MTAPAVAAAERDVATVRLIRAVAALIGAIVATVGAVLLFDRGHTTNEFGPFLSDGSMSEIERWTGPWVVFAAAALLVAALLAIAAVADLARMAGLRRDARRRSAELPGDVRPGTS